MGVSGPQAARDWKAAVTTEPPNVYVSRISRDFAEPPLDDEWRASFYSAGLRFDVR